MAYVVVTTGLIYAVDEPYSDVVAAMDGPDIVELHASGAALTFRCANVLATSDEASALQPYFLPPGDPTNLGGVFAPAD
jgi:hypothetical protein